MRTPTQNAKTRRLGGRLRPRPDPLALRGLRCLWVTNRGAAEITLNSILTFLEAAPDLEDSIHIGCLDSASQAYFTERTPKAHLLDFEAMPDWRAFLQIDPTGDYGKYGSVRFRDVSFARFFALVRLMEADPSPVLYVDGDIGFLRDPRPHCERSLAEHGTTIVAQSDARFTPELTFDDAGRPVDAAGRQNKICTGFMVWTDPKRAIALARDVIAARDANVERSHDQMALNKLPADRRSDIATLPGMAFPNGSYLFDRKSGLKFDARETRTRLKQACLVHANWLSGMDTKIDALRSVGLWRLDDPDAQWTLTLSPWRRAKRTLATKLRMALGTVHLDK